MRDQVLELGDARYSLASLHPIPRSLHTLLRTSIQFPFVQEALKVINSTHDVANTLFHFSPVRSTSAGWCDELSATRAEKKHDKHLSVVRENTNP